MTNIGSTAACCKQSDVQIAMTKTEQSGTILILPVGLHVTCHDSTSGPSCTGPHMREASCGADMPIVLCPHMRHPEHSSAQSFMQLFTMHAVTSCDRRLPDRAGLGPANVLCLMGRSGESSLLQDCGQCIRPRRAHGRARGRARGRAHGRAQKQGTSIPTRHACCACLCLLHGLPLSHIPSAAAKHAVRQVQARTRLRERKRVSYCLPQQRHYCNLNQ